MFRISSLSIPSDFDSNTSRLMHPPMDSKDPSLDDDDDDDVDEGDGSSLELKCLTYLC